MKKLALIACLVVSLFALTAPVASAETQSQSVSVGQNKYCVGELQIPVHFFYEPWNAHYVRSDVYAYCRVTYGTDYLPLDVERIDVWSALWKNNYPSTNVALDGWESHVTNTSFTTTWMESGQCESLANPWPYFSGMSAYFTYNNNEYSVMFSGKDNGNAWLNWYCTPA